MLDVTRALKRVDQFRAVSRDLTRGTITGGVFTAIAYAVLAMLLISEFGAFMRTTYTTNIVMDSNEEDLIQINFDILMFDLPCKYLKLAVWDKFGEERMNSTETFHYIPVDHKGQNTGAAYTKDEISILEQVDEKTDVSEEDKKDLDADWSSSSDHFHHNDFQAAVTFHDFTLVNFFAEWCIHCRKFSPIWMETAARIGEKVQFTDGNGQQTTVKFLRMNCVDFGETCQKAQVAAFPSVRLYKRDGTFEAFQGKRSLEALQEFLTSSIRSSRSAIAHHHAMFNEGCQVQGTLRVPRVPGHFHLQAEAFGNVNVNPAYSNVSHRINHLSFGAREAASWAQRDTIPREMLMALQPLDGRTFTAERFHEAPQHYLKVVSTHVQAKSQVYYQMTHTDRTRRLKKDMSQKAPQARFSYDFSPMSVVVKVKSKRWYEFLTSLFAILGGTYTIVELTSGAVDTVHTAVKEAMGKAN